MSNIKLEAFKDMEDKEKAYHAVLTAKAGETLEDRYEAAIEEQRLLDEYWEAKCKFQDLAKELV